MKSESVVTESSISPEKKTSVGKCLPPWEKVTSFCRWGGGALDAIKGILTGWPEYLRPADPRMLGATFSTYRAETIEFLELMHIEGVWLTFSNGFSLHAEEPTRKEVKDYIQLCHARGIRTMAYLSASSIFWEEAFEREPSLKDVVARTPSDQMVPFTYYETSFQEDKTTWWAIEDISKEQFDRMADVRAFGIPTRYMACLNHPDWQARVFRLVDLAVEAGADSIFFDNIFWHECSHPLCLKEKANWEKLRSDLPSPFNNHFDIYTGYKFIEAIRDHLRKEAPGVALSCNMNKGHFLLSELTTPVSSEDGIEPGFYRGTRPEDKHPCAGQGAGGVFRHNGGLIALLRGASRCKSAPIFVENGYRVNAHHYYSRMTKPMERRTFQLALLEALVFSARCAPYGESAMTRGLYYQEEQILDIARGIGEVNEFARRRSDIFLATIPYRPIGLLQNWLFPDTKLATELVANGFSLKVISERALPEEQDCDVLIIPPGDYDEKVVQWLSINPYRVFIHKAASQNGNLLADLPSISDASVSWSEFHELNALLKQSDVNPSVIVSPKTPVLAIGRIAPDGRRLLHLLNYGDKPVKDLDVRWQISSPNPSLETISLNESRATAKVTDIDDDAITVRITDLNLYLCLACE